LVVAEGTGKPSSAVLFSGQAALTPLLEHAATYTAGTLVLPMVGKGVNPARDSSGSGRSVHPARVMPCNY
jgi:hypothetical protein